MTKEERIRLIAAQLKPNVYAAMLKGQPDVTTDPGGWLSWMILCEEWANATDQAERVLSLADQTA